MQTSSVAPGYTVDSKMTIAPFFMCRPTVLLAPASGVKSGLCASSTGVGTATTMYSASASVAGSVLTDSWSAAFNSAGDNSPVGSTYFL